MPENLPDKISFKPPMINDYTLGRMKKLQPCYERVLLGVLDAILERYERNPRYHFINTKFNVITGRDFASGGLDFRSRNTVYAWIQGRGLEALARHAEWLKSCSLLSVSEKSGRIARIKKMLRAVMARMEAIRRKNGGRLYFCFNPAGKPLEVVGYGKLVPRGGPLPPGSNFSDLFYAKGLLAAAAYLDHAVMTAGALRYLQRVLDDIEQDKFYSDQQAFDPKNKIGHVPGQHRQGHWMIGISAITLAGGITGERRWFQAGERFVRHVMDGHLNLGQFPRLEKYDLFEVADERGQPLVQDGRIICDPGHALEFIGLAAKLLLAMRQKGTAAAHDKLFTDCRCIFPEVFRNNFRLGFNRKAGGICKAFDLVSRTPCNSDLPWWSLPETMRAGLELIALGIDRRHHREIIKTMALCSNSFLKNFVNPGAHFMAYQTRDRDGKVIDVIPATPDADPGYHTGLSIIDFFKIAAKL